MAAGSTYTPIATTTLGSSSPSITFSSISGSYTDLRIVLNAKASPAATVSIRLNGDSGSNYSNTVLYGTGSSAGSQRSSGSLIMESGIGTVGSTNPTLITIDLMNYSNSTTNKTVLFSESDMTGGYVSRTVGLWRSTSAITEVYIWMNSLARNFTAGTTATLYGIQAA